MLRNKLQIHSIQTWLRSDMRNSILWPGSAISMYVLTNLKSALLPAKKTRESLDNSMQSKLTSNINLLYMW